MLGTVDYIFCPSYNVNSSHLVCAVSTSEAVAHHLIFKYPDKLEWKLSDQILCLPCYLTLHASFTCQQTSPIWICAFCVTQLLSDM